jgi:tetratricopeptide (TPR) repeat protein
LVAGRVRGGLAVWLLQSRAAAGLTQEGLAARSGVSVRTISDLERGVAARPYPRSIRLLAQALGLPEGAAEEVIACLRKGSAPTRWPGMADDDTGGVPGPGIGRASASGREWPVPCCLPAGVSHFTGRAEEMALLAGLVGEADGANGMVVISAIGGTAGVGKTALAVHWAHQAAGRFADGQLYLGLRGFDQSGVPVTPGEALAELLSVLGVPDWQIPPRTAARAGLYRSLLAGKRMLIVLDDARDEQQVRPLLPGSPGCLVIITSRNQLSGLAASHGARLLSLGLLCPADARQLLAARLGGDRNAAEPHAVTQIVGLCAGLPLALAVAAARAEANPQVPLAALTAELTDIRSRLDVLDAGDPAASVRAVFSWSFQSLTEPARQMFCLLGLHPGPDISARAAASLAAITLVQARRNLSELARASLISEHVPGRYTFHELLRAYAAEQAETHQSAQTRQAARRRLLDHYLHTARTAALALDPAQDRPARGTPADGTSPEAITDDGQALTWFAAEHKILLAATRQAAETGFSTHGQDLPRALVTYLGRGGYWLDLIATQHLALTCAQQIGDLDGQAQAHRELGRVHMRLGQSDHAATNLMRAVELSQRLGDQAGEARAHLNLSVVYERTGQPRRSLSSSLRALELAQAAADPLLQANACNNAGYEYAVLGDFQQALGYCRRALSMHRQFGSPPLEATIWDSLGYIHHHLGQLREAMRCYRRAIDLFGERGDRYSRARSFSHLGDTQHAAGLTTAARDSWHQALASFNDLRHPDAARVRGKLAKLTPLNSLR